MAPKTVSAANADSLPVTEPGAALLYKPAAGAEAAVAVLSEVEAELLDRDTSGLWRDVNSPVSRFGSEEEAAEQVQARP